MSHMAFFVVAVLLKSARFVKTAHDSTALGSLPHSLCVRWSRCIRALHMIFRILPCLLLACTLSAQDLQPFLTPDLADGFDFPVGGANGKAGYQDQATKRRYKNWIVKESVVDALGLEAHETWNGSGGGTLTMKHLLYAEAATWPMSVSTFIRSHRHLLVPAQEERVLIAVKHAYRLHVCEKGQVKLTLPVALGQRGWERKTMDGDNGTLLGEYRITQKVKGPFDSTFGGYLGAAWLRLNYPNAYDARTALSEERISKKEHDRIAAAALHGSLAPTDTSLGGGIGIHGWISDWPDGANHLTWGCLSLRKADLLQVYDLVNKGTRVLILP